jgi:hypothetical protein
LESIRPRGRNLNLSDKLEPEASKKAEQKKLIEEN